MIAEFPEKLQFLFEPCRYKVVYGGRGGTKSWGFARALLILGTQRALRVLCARETQKSIVGSVHKLLSDQIAALALGHHYIIEKGRIIGANGTEFIFEGLKHNVNNIKSLEACDIVWVEEAQSVSKGSWDVLIPTIRKNGSEIWVSFNPDLATDDTYKRFVLEPPSNAKVVKVGWQDNPWFPEELRILKDDTLARSPADYDHIWEGQCVSALVGAIYEAELKQAEDEKRITSVPYDRTRPVDTFWDLGFGDLTTIWFAQALPSGAYRLIDYLEDSGKTISHYVVQLQSKGYVYGTDWVPHDATDTIIHGKLAGAGNASRSIEMLMRAAGRKVRIAPKTHVASGINAARTMFPACWFDAEKCADGLQALRHYQWGELTDAEERNPDPRPGRTTGTQRREPLHNWASHGADGFRTMAVTIRQPTIDRAQAQQRQKSGNTEHSWMG